VLPAELSRAIDTAYEANEFKRVGALRLHYFDWSGLNEEPASPDQLDAWRASLDAAWHADQAAVMAYRSAHYGAWASYLFHPVKPAHSYVAVTFNGQTGRMIGEPRV